MVIVSPRLLACQQDWPFSGPLDVEELSNWAEDPIKRILDEDSSAFSDVPQTIEHTSKWCGTATSTIAWRMAAQKIEALAGIKFNSGLYGHCEYDRICRMCLRKNKPRHMHVDVLEPFDEELVADVFKKQEEFRETLYRAEDSKQKSSDPILGGCDGVCRQPRGAFHEESVL